ncbi:HK97 family phage prohead protease [Microterricola gilva]|uniref:HK97 family phage prohead protease n=1 Tax=Microterricola gilva TaxID=393267 RepID=A0A4Q8AKZ1_9MICO|nr:HK97 family phage prohead protease [Microterricola gilva]RZU64603.1 HK97 family phage prohead protease [Microterricola gilva]
MNRKQLDRLHRLGLIGDVQHTAGIATLNAGAQFRPKLSAVRVNAAITLAVDPTARTISGTASIYGEFIPSHYMYLDAGCLNSRMPLNKNKMLVDHDMRQPVGYLTELDEGTLAVTYTIPEGEEGDDALASAEKGLRDGLSVGFTASEYYFDEDLNIHVTAADWYETSLVAVPAVADAGVNNVAAAVATSPTEPKEFIVNRHQLAAAFAAGTITQEQYDAALAAIVATEAATPTPAVPVAADVQAGPTHDPAPAANLEVNQRPMNLAAVAQRVASGVRSGELTNSEGVALAIGEFLPSQDDGQAFTRPEWLGELRTLTKSDRPWIDAIGSPLPLTSLKAEGWRWDEEPEVNEHSLDTFDEVTGNDPTTAGDAFTPFMVAAAHRVQRSVIDFADPQFTVDFLTARMRRYNIKSNIGIRSRMLAAASAPTGTVTKGGVVAVLKQLVKDVRPIGGRLNRVFLDNLLYEELEDLDVGPTSTLPLWLRQASIGINLADGTADVAGLAIVNDPALEAGQALGFDNSIVDVRESPVIQPTAVAISVAAVDMGLFGYLRLDDHDPRGIVKRKYVPAPTP